MPFEPSSIYELDTAERARRWVADRLGVEPDVLRPLSGGVSNTVLLAEAGGQRLVIKQSLPQLRVEAEWFCNRNRILRECDALKLLAPMLPPGSVPRVVLEDSDNYAFAMTAAPEGAETWKTHLLRGEIDTGIARQLGEFLARLIASTPEVDSRFADMSVFDTLRLDAYYRYTAARHPDISDQLYRLITDCETQRISLVHGDFSPKNILVDGGAAVVIDWECVHYGNPAFDAAFLLNHLLLKSFHVAARAHEFATAGLAFYRALGTHGDRLEASTVRHWGGLLLARVDGKSPVEYITDAGLRQHIRNFARDLILSPPDTVDAVFDRRLHCL